MTHDTRFSLRFCSHPQFLRAAVVYDFIPLDWPGCLPTSVSRMEYFARLARLRNFDVFFPLSQFTARRLCELLGIWPARAGVTGASVRSSLYELRKRLKIASSPYNTENPYFLIISADDTRKNTETAVKAVRLLNELCGSRIPLKVIGHYEGSYKVLGHYGDSYRNVLLRLAGHTEGSGFLEFYPNISDEEIVSLHAGAIAAIAPSYIEGFSLPVVEASVCGCPVVASTCAAHLELIEQPEALFPPDDANLLCEKLYALLHSPGLRASLLAAQAHLGPKFHEQAVGTRFWDGIEAAAQSSTAAAVIARPRKPWVAFLSPFPPDQSGVARFTAMTVHAGAKLFDSDLYTDAPRPLTFQGSFQDRGGVTLAPLLSQEYNSIISVLGNSPYHIRTFEFFERYGGPCILHDARLTRIYFYRLGQEGFLKFASTILGRSVSMEEVNLWLQDRDLESLFLEPIIERASPLIVHTATQQALLKRRYGADAHVATCCPTNFFADEELTDCAKEAARARNGIPPGTFVVSSFGLVDKVKAMEFCILAIEILRSWGIPAELYFVGGAGPQKAEVDRISNLFGIGQHVHCGTDFVDEQTYRDFLVASDAALQLRVYGLGQFSAALADCISAGLPGVANSDLAMSCDAPDYVSRVPDRFSPLQVAEQLALIWETRRGRASHEDARVTYLDTHNFEHYGKRLIEILGIA